MDRISLVCVGIVTICALGVAPAGAQETRTASNAGERAAKAQDSSSSAQPERGPFERAFKWAIEATGRSSDTASGLRPTFGGLIPGSGLSAGARYRHTLFADSAAFDGSATISVRRYFELQASVQWPQLLAKRLSLVAQVTRQDFTQINYFGTGPATSADERTDYRLRNVGVVGSATVHPRNWLALGGRVGYLNPALESGLGATAPSTEERLDDASAPGLHARPRYSHADAFVETDWRNASGYPANGGSVRVGLAHFHDLEHSGFSFRRIDLDAAEYVPLFRRNWSLALRSRVTLSDTGGGSEVPFYLLPSLGGSSTLRGYPEYRFHDRNVALVSAEYRWPVFRMMDAAVFVDAGTVSSTATGLWDARPKHDQGFGVRLHSAGRSIVRIDVAKGREGVRVAASLSAPFGSSRNVAPYVP